MMTKRIAVGGLGGGCQRQVSGPLAGRCLSGLILILVLSGWLEVGSPLSGLLSGPVARAAQVDETALREAGFAPERLERIDTLITEAIEAGNLPGCVFCFGRHDRVLWQRAYGNKAVAPEVVAMTEDTVFDLASLTKPIATATSILQLVERGHVRLGQRVSDHLPEFGRNGKEAITIEQLLIHQSGLIPDNPLDDYLHGPEVAWERICDLGLVAPVGSEFKYSDVNFIVLGELVRRVTGQDLNAYSRAAIFEPLRMAETGFLPPADLQARAAWAEQRDGEWMRGQVHDPRAYHLGGVAGHAGLFSTAADLSKYAQSLLRTHLLGTQPPGERILSPAGLERMTRRHPVSRGWRGLGWDKQTGFSTNKGDLLSDAAYGHGGFTGTVLWIDPQQDLFLIFLSHRLHPAGGGSVNGLAGQLANVVVAAQTSREADGAARVGSTISGPVFGDVLTGIDVLVRADMEGLAGQRIGLITNPTGVDRQGRLTSEILATHPRIKLTALFSPEHGPTANLDVSQIGDSVDAVTGRVVYSLYGKTRRPTVEMLAEVDTLVFDIQDIGTRFYTYISTMGEAMRAASEHGKRFVVLDRPNPLNGVTLEGPMLDAGGESFVGYHRLPLRHGMTVGELAGLLRSELELDLDLWVVPCEGWSRDQYWDATGLRWINPSPNMRSLNQALLYPGMGLWEMTNVSVGRGTDTPFEWLGAPWIDGVGLARVLNSQALPGVRFVPVRFTPQSSKYAGELCEGIQVIVTDRSQFASVDCGIAIGAALNQGYPQWETKELNRLLGNRQVAEALLSGSEWADIKVLWLPELKAFDQRRQSHLLYGADGSARPFDR